MNPKLQKLKETREKNLISIKTMARYLGISRTMYSYIESGQRRLSYEMAYNIAKIFDLKPDDLFYDDMSSFLKEVFI